MGFLDGFTEAFLPAYQRSGEQFLRQRNEDRDYGLRKDLHDLQVAGIKRDQSIQADQDRLAADLVGDETSAPPPAQVPAPVPAGLPTQAPASVAPRAPAAPTAVAPGSPPAQAPASAAPPLPTASRAPLSTDDTLRRAQGLAARRGNYADVATLGEKRKLNKFQEGYDEYAKSIVKDMQSMSPRDYIAKYGGALNANGSIDGYMTFDDKTGRIAFSHKDGIDYLKPEDVMIQQLAAYKLGNGRVEEGAAMMQSTSARVQARVDAALDDARRAVTAQADVHYKGKAAENDTRRTGIAAAGLGLQRAQASRPDYQILGPSQDGKGMLVMDKRTGRPRLEPLPEGVSAEDLFPKTTGLKPGKEFSPHEYAQTVSQLVSGGMALPEARQQADELYGRAAPVNTMIERLKAIEAERLAAQEKARSGNTPAQPESPYTIGNRASSAVRELVAPVVRGLTPPSAEERFRVQVN